MRWAGHSMRSIAAVLLTSLLAGCGPQSTPPADDRNDPPAQAIDVVELSAVDARDRMAAGTLTSRALTQAYLDRIRQIDDAGPMLNAVIEISPTADRRCGGARRRAQGRQSAQPAARHSDPDQRQHRRVGMVNSAGSLALADNRPKQDAFIVAPPARCGRGDPRQDEPQRVGELPLDAIDVGLELARRTDEKPVCARSQSVRLELGHRRRDRREPGVDRRRHRDRRQHHLPRVGERPGRHQADGRPRQPPRHHPDFRFAGHGRTDGPIGCAMRRCC